jgi:hypothetical protein
MNLGGLMKKGGSPGKVSSGTTESSVGPESAQRAEWKALWVLVIHSS